MPHSYKAVTGLGVWLSTMLAYYAQYACDSSTGEVEGGSDLLLHNEFKPVWDTQDPGKQTSKQANEISKSNAYHGFGDKVGVQKCF